MTIKQYTAWIIVIFWSTLFVGAIGYAVITIPEVREGLLAMFYGISFLLIVLACMGSFSWAVWVIKGERKDENLYPMW